MNLGDVKGLKSKRLESLNNAGIFTPSDLLMYFPQKYVFPDKANPTEFSEGDEILIRGRVTGVRSVYARSRMLITKAKILTDDGREFEAVWYNMRYVASRLAASDAFYFLGKVKLGSIKQLSVPEIIPQYECRGIFPIYKSIKGIPTKTLKEAISAFLDEIEIWGYIPEQIESKYGLFSLNNAVKLIHRPTDSSSLERALESVQLNFLAYYISTISLNKDRFSKKRQFFYTDSFAKIQEVMKTLPFNLTTDQQNALYDIIKDLNSSERLSRLLMGDVGSGKTVVAFLSMLYAALGGFQTALMAPTEILATQHFAKASEFFMPLGIGVAILTGGQSAAQRRDNLFKISSGSAQIIIGTHALISANVDFRRLSLIVIDEQHKFGVHQRAALEDKAAGADVLVMSATPIPRTLALTVYGNLSKSEIRSKPLDRGVVFTRFVPRTKTDSMIDYLIKEAEVGNQTYVVCPRIEDEENYGVEGFYRKLKSIYSDCAYLHGKMREDEKRRIMLDFSAGKIGVLISTTVIEVGIDVPSAVNMVILDAERFGLSQLHQLRGRVGRGSKQGYCFVLSDSKEAYETRLKFFCACNDGFELAEEDFRLRGAGDFFGTRQHGNSSFIKLDEVMLIKAKSISDEILSDPGAREELALRCHDDGFIKGITLN